MHLLIVKGGWGRFISMHLLRRKGCLQMRVLRRWGRGRSWVSHMAGSSHSIPACRGSERKNRRSLLLILRWQPWPTFHKDRLMQTWWYAYNRGARRALPEVSLAMRRQLGGGQAVWWGPTGRTCVSNSTGTGPDMRQGFWRLLWSPEPPEAKRFISKSFYSLRQANN